MTITQRLSYSIGLLIASIIILSSYALYGLSASQARFSYVEHTTIKGIVQLNKIISEAVSLRLQLNRHMLGENTQQWAASENKIALLLPVLNEDMKKYRNDTGADRHDAGLSARADGDLKNLEKKLNDFYAYSRQDNNTEALAKFDSPGGIASSMSMVVDDLQQQITYNIHASEVKKTENDRDYKRSFLVMLSLSCASIFVLGSLCIFTVIRIRRGLNQMKETMTEISDTLDLSKNLAVSGNDEISQTASAFNALIQRFHHVLDTVIVSTESVNVASREIAAGNIDLSSRTEEQAASITETSASMQAITDAVKQSAEGASRVSNLASQAGKQVEDSDRKVKEMLSTISDIRDSSAKISEITGVMEGIAFQTNILALNAAVEAAHAGEEGRGFAVVASEVRMLAQRSSNSAKEIKTLIENTSLLIALGSEQAAEVNAHMETVNRSVKEVYVLTEEISSLSQEQSQGISQINLAISQMDDVTQQNAALVEQASAAAQSLEDQAENLGKVVSAFRLTHPDMTLSV